MDKVGIRFSESKYIYMELDPETNKVTITAEINGTAVAGTTTLTAAKAAKIKGDR